MHRLSVILVPDTTIRPAAGGPRRDNVGPFLKKEHIHIERLEHCPSLGSACSNTVVGRKL